MRTYKIVWFVLIVIVSVTVIAVISYQRYMSPPSVNWSSNGEWITFSCGILHQKSSLFIMRPDGSELQQITHSRIEAFSPSWSPDGEWIVFVSDSALYRVRPNGQNMRQILDNTSDSAFNFSDRTPSWSPDNQWIAFRSNRSGIAEHEVYRVRSDGTDLERLTTGHNGVRHITWSPDSTQIAFASNGLHILNIDTNVTTLIEEGYRIYDPAWSPDGEIIAYAIEDATSIDLFTEFIHSEERHRLTYHSSPETNLMWSPDGQQIAFSASGDNDFSQIHIIDRYGNNREVITHLECHATSPSWIDLEG